MNDTSLQLSAGLDRSLAWQSGGSVRYVVTNLAAQSTEPRREVPALNLALAIDISGSMSGPKIAAARNAALAVAEAMTERDRLSIIAFDDRVELLLDARNMDAAGRAAAVVMIQQLRARGHTNLFEGWLQAAERVAHAMKVATDASHRVLLISDGCANVGIVDPNQIANQVGALLERGVLTSALGIGEGYDEQLLGAISEAGGGSLHDAAGGAEVAEVVLGELHEGRVALLDRVTLRVSTPATLRAELVGPWSHAVGPAGLEVMVGSLLPGQTKSVIVRLHCPEGTPGTMIKIGVSADGALPAGGIFVKTVPVDLELCLARGADNNAQPRNLARCLAVVNAWQAEIIRNAVSMNRDSDRRAASHYIERELGLLERYACGVPGAAPLLRDLVLVQQNIHEAWNERTRKEVYSMARKMSRFETDRRADPRASLAERFGR